MPEVASWACGRRCSSHLCYIYAIRHEQPQMLWPQIYFLKVEICLLMAGAVFSISYMCMGIEATNLIFSDFISVPQMELNFGPRAAADSNRRMFWHGGGNARK
ncbi:hypothetical protein niasHT_014992 [Heterodera trifolii]|uniref:Uncharacterized protein n=1 Tax=Heterodera trifolii TaxID=157864 RepID=A0ABD2L0W6_9BILA